MTETNQIIEVKNYIALLFQQSYENDAQKVIHRTNNCLIMNNQRIIPPEQKKRELQNKGWMAPSERPYQALGEFTDPVEVVEGVKDHIDHSREMTVETQKIISRVKRSNNPMFKGRRPERTYKILLKDKNENQESKSSKSKLNIKGDFINLKTVGGDSSLMNKMLMIEQHFVQNPQALLRGSKSANPYQNIQNLNQTDHVYFNNQSLVTGSMKKFMKKKEANVALKDEIAQSSLRLKAAKFGHKLEDIVPSYNNTFYLPDSTNYFERNKTAAVPSRRPISKESLPQQFDQKSLQDQLNQSISIEQGTRDLQQDPLFNQAKGNSMKDSVFITEGSQGIVRMSTQDRITQSMERSRWGRGWPKGFKKLNESGMPDSLREVSIQNQSLDRISEQNLREAQCKTAGVQRRNLQNKIMNKTQGELKKYMAKQPTKINAVSTKYRDNFFNPSETDYPGSIGVQTKNQDRASTAANTQNLDNSSFNKTYYQPDKNIRFVSIIDGKPIKPAFLQLVNYEQFSFQEQENMKNLSNILENQKNKKGERSRVDQAELSINWNSMLVEDLNELMKEKVENKAEEIKKQKQDQVQYMGASLFKNKGEKVEKQYSSNQEPHKKLSSVFTDNSTLLVTNTTDYDDKGSQEQVQVVQKLQTTKHLTQFQEQLLNKLIQFDSLDMENAEDMKIQLYELFFKWKNDPKHDHHGSSKQRSTKIGSHLEQIDELRNHKGISKEELEERKKKLQLRLDQELIEFEENGGFAQVLKDIFNPQDVNSIELDSVFQLQTVCKAFYQKKDKINQNLIETLDAMANERPKVLTMKKKQLDIDNQIYTLQENMELMRINAEKERVNQFKSVAKDQAIFYYRVLKKFTEQNQKQEREKQAEKLNQDPQFRIRFFLREIKLKQALSFVADSLKSIIENGQIFRKDEFFLMQAHNQSSIDDLINPQTYNPNTQQQTFNILNTQNPQNPSQPISQPRDNLHQYTSNAQSKQKVQKDDRSPRSPKDENSKNISRIGSTMNTEAVNQDQSYLKHQRKPNKISNNSRKQIEDSNLIQAPQETRKINLSINKKESPKISKKKSSDSNIIGFTQKQIINTNQSSSKRQSKIDEQKKEEKKEKEGADVQLRGEQQKIKKSEQGNDTQEEIIDTMDDQKKNSIAILSSRAIGMNKSLIGQAQKVENVAPFGCPLLKLARINTQQIGTMKKLANKYVLDDDFIPDEVIKGTSSNSQVFMSDSQEDTQTDVLQEECKRLEQALSQLKSQKSQNRSPKVKNFQLKDKAKADDRTYGASIERRRINKHRKEEDTCQRKKNKGPSIKSKSPKKDRSNSKYPTKEFEEESSHSFYSTQKKKELIERFKEQSSIEVKQSTSSDNQNIQKSKTRKSKNKVSQKKKKRLTGTKSHISYNSNDFNKFHTKSKYTTRSHHEDLLKQNINAPQIIPPVFNMMPLGYQLMNPQLAHQYQAMQMYNQQQQQQQQYASLVYQQQLAQQSQNILSSPTLHPRTSLHPDNDQSHNNNNFYTINQSNILINSNEKFPFPQTVSLHNKNSLLPSSPVNQLSLDPDHQSQLKLRAKSSNKYELNSKLTENQKPDYDYVNDNYSQLNSHRNEPQTQKSSFNQQRKSEQVRQKSPIDVFQKNIIKVNLNDVTMNSNNQSSQQLQDSMYLNQLKEKFLNGMKEAAERTKKGSPKGQKQRETNSRNYQSMAKTNSTPSRRIALQKYHEKVEDEFTGQQFRTYQLDMNEGGNIFGEQQNYQQRSNILEKFRPQESYQIPQRFSVRPNDIAFVQRKVINLQNNMKRRNSHQSDQFQYPQVDSSLNHDLKSTNFMLSPPPRLHRDHSPQSYLASSRREDRYQKPLYGIKPIDLHLPKQTEPELFSHQRDYIIQHDTSNSISAAQLKHLRYEGIKSPNSTDKHQEPNIKSLNEKLNRIQNQIQKSQKKGEWKDEQVLYSSRLPQMQKISLIQNEDNLDDINQRAISVRSSLIQKEELPKPQIMVIDIDPPKKKKPVKPQLKKQLTHTPSNQKVEKLNSDQMNDKQIYESDFVQQDKIGVLPNRDSKKPSESAQSPINESEDDELTQRMKVIQKRLQERLGSKEREHQRDRSETKANPRTKEEILEQRKQMMKSKISTKRNNFVQNHREQNPDKKQQEQDKKKEPVDLMSRLASGQKGMVDMKEMKRMTVKNYENLPEIKKKKEEERKKEEFRQRQQLVKQYQEQMRQKRIQKEMKKQGTGTTDGSNL